MTHLMRLSAIHPFGERVAQLMNLPTMTSQHQGYRAPQNLGGQTSHAPLSYHLEASPSHYTLALCVPGVAPSDIEITTESNQLQVTLRSSSQEEATQAQWLYPEIDGSNGQRSFNLPKDADIDSISGKLERGIINISIPRVQKSPPRVVPIEG
ncbi:MAG: Hsp20/alpha crystallin family protein [Pseudomonadales bacterium]|jgi:HSP20 family molecular chaperone IbpA